MDRAFDKEVLVDNTAKGAGIWTMICAALGNIALIPQDAGAVTSGLRWMLGLVIMGLFGMASSALAVWLKWRLDRRGKGSESVESK